MAAEWLEKLRRYASVTEVQIKPNPKNTKDPKLQMEHEGEKVRALPLPGSRSGTCHHAKAIGECSVIDFAPELHRPLCSCRLRG